MYYKDYSDAREPLLAVCENKDGFACYRLAELHQLGRGGPVNLLTAATYYEQACTYEHFEGCEKRAQLARDGHGGPPVELEYAIKACEGRRNEMCTAAGLQLAEGRGVDRDVEHAIKIYETGCGYGETASCVGAGDLLAAVGGKGDTKARALSAYVNACIGHNGDGCLKVGIFLHEGIGVAPDVAKARMHFNKACEFSIPDGCSAVKQIDAGGGTKQVDLALTTTAEQHDGSGLPARSVSCNMTEFGMPALDSLLAKVARHKTALDACAEDGAAVAVTLELEKGKVQKARTKGKTNYKVAKCVTTILEKIRLKPTGKCQAVLLLGNPEGAAKSMEERLARIAKAKEAAAAKSVHISLEEEE